VRALDLIARIVAGLAALAAALGGGAIIGSKSESRSAESWCGQALASQAQACAAMCREE